MENKLTPDLMLAINSILDRYSVYRSSFDGINQGGYHGADTFRNTWAIFGYPQQIDFNAYWNMYLRGGVAYSCINKPVNKRWSIYPTVYDEAVKDDKVEVDRNPTEFEKAVQRLVDEFDLWGVLKELDECQRIGLYGGITITAKERSKIDDLRSTKLECVNYVDGLIALNPCYESQLDITSSDRDDDMQSKRYGQPKWYNYREGAGVQGSTFGGTVSIDKEIHWSRAFVFSEFAKGNGVIGRPALMPVFNSLMNWYKIVGSAAEGFFKNAKQRLNMNITDQNLARLMFSKDDTTGAQSDYSAMIEEFEKGFNNTLDTAGIEAKVLQAAVSDPSSAAGLCLQDICAGIEIPKTELIGFETGERSSTENANAWNVSNQAWRETTGTKMVTRFLEHLVYVGVLPKPKHGRIYVEWPDISASSVEKRIDNASKLSSLITALNNAGREMAVEAIERDLLPSVLDIKIEQVDSDEPEKGLSDGE